MSRGATPKAGREPAYRGLGRCLRTMGIAVGGLASVGLAGFGGWQLWQIPVERVLFSGAVERVAKAQLQSLVNANLNAGFLSVDIERIRDPLEAQPWVFKAVVKRRWPSHLEIEVTEQIAIARWGEDAYLNHEGNVFRPDAYVPMPELPQLQGPEGSQLELMRHYQFMREQIQALGLELVSLKMDERGGLLARLRTGGELVFGRGQFEEKLVRFMGVYYADLAGREQDIRAVDLRYRHGLAVSWRTEKLDV